MRVLVACEFSGIVRDAFIAAGHDAVSCDLLPSERDGPHIVGDAIDVAWNGGPWDMMIAHPPCTTLTNAGVRHLHSVPSRNGVLAKLHGQARWAQMERDARFFLLLLNAPIERVAIENPTPHKYARALIGPYDAWYQPWMFDEPETKRTCLWLRGLPPLLSTVITETRTPRVHMTSPGPDRWKERSRTLPGIASAMAAQWGTL